MKVWFFRLFTIFVSFFVSVVLLFLLGELYFRFVFDLGFEYRKPSYFEFHQQRGFTLKPGDYDVFEVTAFRKSNIHINSLGIRDRERSLKPSAGKRRVTILGDSFVFAEVLNYGDRFTDQLENLFADGQTEVVNVSSPAYGTAQEILLIEELMGRGFDVGDTVVLVFFINDVCDNLGLDYGNLEARFPWQPVFAVNDSGMLIQAQPPEMPSYPVAAMIDWVFYDFFVTRAAMLLNQYPILLTSLTKVGVPVPLPRTPGIITTWYSPGWEERWGATETILQYWFENNKFQAVDKVIMYLPSPFQVEEGFKNILINFKDRDARYRDCLNDRDRPQRMLKKFCADYGVPVIDTTGALRQASRKGVAYFPREGHLNEYGSRIVAQEIYGYLEQKE